MKLKSMKINNQLNIFKHRFYKKTMVYDISKKGIEDVGIATNRNFVDTMHKYFGLTSNPGYPKVEVKEIISCGAANYNPDIIILRDFFSDSLTLMRTICHESAHLLMPNAREEFQKRGRNFHPRNRFLYEITSELAGIIYFDKSFNGADKFLENESMYCQKLAWDIFQSKPELLTPMSNLDMREARKFFLPFLKRPLYNSSRNPYSTK